LCINGIKILYIGIEIEEKSNKNKEIEYYGNLLKHHHHHHNRHHSHHEENIPIKEENLEKKYIPKEDNWEFSQPFYKNPNVPRRERCNLCGAPKALMYYPVKGILYLYNNIYIKILLIRYL
jgi:hypothetical protein